MKFNINKSKKSQAGFSLVELMIVVSIIGILSSIAVPQFQKFIFKARQTEAKTGLTGLYTAEQAFYSEYAQYTAAFGEAGYKPEGNYFYNIGFGEATADVNLANYLAAHARAAGVGKNINTAIYCADASNPCTNMANVGTIDIAWKVDNTASPPIFLAGAITKKLNPDDTTSGIDTWSITNKKALFNNAKGTL